MNDNFLNGPIPPEMLLKLSGLRRPVDGQHPGSRMASVSQTAGAALPLDEHGLAHAAASVGAPAAGPSSRED